MLREGSKDVLHNTSAETCEEDNAERDEIEVILAIGVLACPWVVVAEGEEFRGRRPSLGQKVVCEKHEGDEVEGETCDRSRVSDCV